MIKLKELTPEQLKAALKKEHIFLLDTRPASSFTLGFIPAAINISLDEHFEHWAQTLIPSDTPIVLIADQKEQIIADRLSEAGLDNFKGFLKEGYEAWVQAAFPIDMIIDVTADELALDLPFDKKIAVIDVRNTEEYDSGHVVAAENLPLERITEPLQIAMLDDESNMYIHGGTDNRSVIACSVLKKEGFHNIRNVLGGFSVIKDTPNLAIEVPKKK